MDALEESVFTRNVPGKYSKWKEEDDDRRIDEEEYEKEENIDEIDDPEPEWEGPPGADREDPTLRTLNADIPIDVKYAILKERGEKMNTGVKGVLADYKQSKALDKAIREANEKKRTEILKRIALGAIRVEEEDDEEDILQKFNNANVESDTDNSDDNDDAFMREYREQRLKELRMAQSLPSFGRVKDISSEELISETEDVDPRTYVVVHLYESSVLACTRMNRILDEIAAEWKTVKFLRLNASRNEIPIDRVALPILTIYNSGETVEVLAGLLTEIGEFFTKDEIQWLLEPRIKNK